MQSLQSTNFKKAKWFTHFFHIFQLIFSKPIATFFYLAAWWYIWPSAITAKKPLLLPNLAGSLATRGFFNILRYRSCWPVWFCIFIIILLIILYAYWTDNINYSNASYIWVSLSFSNYLKFFKLIYIRVNPWPHAVKSIRWHQQSTLPVLITILAFSTRHWVFQNPF